MVLSVRTKTADLKRPAPGEAFSIAGGALLPISCSDRVFVQIILLDDKSPKPLSLRISRKGLWAFSVALAAGLVSLYLLGAWTVIRLFPEVDRFLGLSIETQRLLLFNEIGVLKGRVEALEKKIKTPSPKGSARKDAPGEYPGASHLQEVAYLTLSDKDQTRETRLDRLSLSIAMIDSTVTLLELTGHKTGLPDLPALASPLDGEVSSGFGLRIHPIKGVPLPHEGIDIPAPLGTPVRAFADGVVVATHVSGKSLGKSVDIDHGKNLISRYGHLDGIVVKIGDIVAAGDKIARVGSSGMSTGSHLHFEIESGNKKIDPLTLVSIIKNRLHGKKT